MPPPSPRVNDFMEYVVWLGLVMKAVYMQGKKYPLKIAI